MLKEEKKVLENNSNHLHQSTSDLNKIIQNHAEQLEKSFKLPKDCVFITRLEDGKLVSVNDAFISKIGVSKDKVIGKSLAGLPIWKDKNDHKKFLKALGEYNSFNSFETIINIKDKGTLPVLIFGGLIQYNGENCVFAAIRDISKSKQVEKFLQESESKYRTLFEQSGNAIFLEDSSADIVTF
jgi:PAS domain S-box-containing protein